MKRMHAILTGTLLVVAAVPACAQNVIPKLSVTSSQMQGSCPTQIYSAQGVIKVDKPTTLIYFWQSSLSPSSETGTVKLTNSPPISAKLASAGSLTVTSPKLVVPLNYTASMRLAVGGYVSNSNFLANKCSMVKSVKLLSDDATSRCKDGRVVLHGMVETASNANVRYVPVLNNKLGSPVYVSFSSAGFHKLDVIVQTDMTQPAVAGFALIDPVSMASKTLSYKACPAPR